MGTECRAKKKDALTDRKAKRLLACQQLYQWWTDSLIALDCPAGNKSNTVVSL
jgi:hypothetical protein